MFVNHLSLSNLFKSNKNNTIIASKVEKDVNYHLFNKNNIDYLTIKAKGTLQINKI